MRGRLNAERGGISILNRRVLRREERWNGEAHPKRIGDGARISAELLLELGVNPEQRGFELLRDGVRVTAEHMPECRRRPFDTLFPVLGAMCGRSDDRAGQAMYGAIRACWDREETEPGRPFPFVKRPTASETVYALAEHARDLLAARSVRP
jgi:hypothetical protein